MANQDSNNKPRAFQPDALIDNIAPVYIPDVGVDENNKYYEYLLGKVKFGEKFRNEGYGRTILSSSAFIGPLYKGAINYMAGGIQYLAEALFGGDRDVALFDQGRKEFDTISLLSRGPMTKADQLRETEKYNESLSNRMRISALAKKNLKPDEGGNYDPKDIIKFKNDVLKDETIPDELKQRTSLSIDNLLKRNDKGEYQGAFDNILTDDLGGAGESSDPSAPLGLTTEQTKIVNDVFKSMEGITNSLDDMVTQLSNMKKYVYDDGKKKGLTPLEKRKDPDYVPTFMDQQFDNYVEDIKNLDNKRHRSLMLTLAGIDMRQELESTNSLISLKKKELKDLIYAPDAFRNQYFQQQSAPIKQSITNLMTVAPNFISMPAGILQGRDQLALAYIELMDKLRVTSLTAGQLMDNPSVDVSKTRDNQ